MGLITTMSGLFILGCDEFDCNNKVESHNEIRVKQVASLSGWKNRGDQWICPTCVKKEEALRRSTKSKKPTKRPESTL